MGKYKNSNLAHGTSGSPQLTINQSNLESKINKLSNEMLINELKENNINFNEKKMKFITKDKSNQIIWLEEGSLNAGLKHIIEHHGDDFKNAYNISKESIPKFIKEVITNGRIVDNVDSGIGYTKVYKYKSKYYLVTGIGYNGFIVSAFPYNDKGGKYD